MKIEIDGTTLTIDDKDAVIARNIVNSFVDVVRRSAHSTKNDALYLTILIMMYRKSTELLDEFGADNLKFVLESRCEATAAFE